MSAVPRPGTNPLPRCLCYREHFLLIAHNLFHQSQQPLVRYHTDLPTFWAFSSRFRDHAVLCVFQEELYRNPCPSLLGNVHPSTVSWTVQTYTGFNVSYFKVYPPLYSRLLVYHSFQEVGPSHPGKPWPPKATCSRRHAVKIVLTLLQF